MRPILCGGTDHDFYFHEKGYEFTDCPPPELVPVRAHDPRTGYPTIYYETICPVCYQRRQYAKRKAYKNDRVT